MNYTQSIGNIVELQCISKFIEMGFQCSIPYGNSALYDFIADINGELIKIQCKSAVYVKNNTTGERDKAAFMINCTRMTTNTKETKRYRYSEEDIDYFATYFNNQVYLIPVSQCSGTKTLRFIPPKNGQLDYNKAQDYTIEKFLEHLQDQEFVEDLKEHDIQINYGSKKEVFLCAQCNKIQVSKKDGICPSCVHFNTRVVQRPSREELKEMIRKMSFLSIGKKFGVTDNAIRKWCAAMKLPIKKREINSYSEQDWNNI